MVYTDPDGEFFLSAFLIAFAATTVKGYSGQINNLNDFAASMTIGTIAGMAGGWIGNLTESAMLAGAAAGTTAGAGYYT